jgi:hypothetical protein
MPEASSVTFGVLLGGKVTPQLLKSFKDLEDLMKKQGRQRKPSTPSCEGAYKETLKLETEGEEATADFLESLGCSDVERVLLLLK